ncbi:hypothetical protein [Kitasatospora sp. NPDC058218]|uniref:hypothetical protein n=1 Tax=Kitasatospora sp. NPDC058218 TaxID=3346385 RepID=UPI0036D9E897
MTFSPGGNMPAAPMLFGAPTCAMCTTELEWGGKGRRPKYCSKACSSKADRARGKEKQGQALAAAAETPRGETGLPEGLANDPSAAELLTLGEELIRHDRLLLLQLDRAARDADPALARQAAADVRHSAYGVMQRHRELVERLLDQHPTQARAVGQPGPAAEETPRGETRTGSGAAPGMAGAAPACLPAPRPAAVTVEPAVRPADQSPRGETTTEYGPGRTAEDARLTGVGPRGETTASPGRGENAPAAPRGETPATASRPAPAPARTAPGATVAHPDDSDLQPDAVLRATSDPVRRFGPPTRTDDLHLTFGPGWTTTSWSAPEAADVHQLHHRGVRVGWTALLGDGPWGLGGWIAVLLLADGRAEPLLGNIGRPRIHRDWSEALDALRKARLTPPATAARTPDTARPAPKTSGWIGPRAAEPAAGTVTVPRDPLHRGLPRSMDVHIPLDPATFGYAWVLSGWTVQPDVMVVLGEGYPVGWVERGLDGGDGWVAVYEGYFLGDPATQQAALHDTPELAARIIHQAHVHDL